MRATLSINQKTLGLYLGVSEVTVRRWERLDGVFPRNHRWLRIREMWDVVKLVRDKGSKFWADREEPPSFKF